MARETGTGSGAQPMRPSPFREPSGFPSSAFGFDTRDRRDRPDPDGMAGLQYPTGGWSRPRTRPSASLGRPTHAIEGRNIVIRSTIQDSLGIIRRVNCDGLPSMGLRDGPAPRCVDRTGLSSPLAASGPAGEEAEGQGCGRQDRRLVSAGKICHGSRSPCHRNRGPNRALLLSFGRTTSCWLNAGVRLS